MKPSLRRARSEDATALAELIWLAGESPSSSSYDVFFGGDGSLGRERLRRLIRAQARTHFSYSNFFVAEVDGEVAAGACGFNPHTSGKQNILPALHETGWSSTEIADAMQRMSSVLVCAAEEPLDAWILEHVATLPRFRGQGLARGVVSRAIEEGFAEGFDRVRLSLLVGNEAARGLYVNLGFRPDGRPRTDPRFEAVMGSPGTETLVLDREGWISAPSGDAAIRQEVFQGRAPGALESSLEFWKGRLTGAPAFLDLPADSRRPVIQSFATGRVWRDVPPDMNRKLSTIGRPEGDTVFPILLATFDVLLSRYTAAEDLVVGCPIVDGTPSEGSAGFPLDTLPIRTDLSGNPTFRELLRRVRSVTLEACAHRGVSFERIVDELRPDRDPSRRPIYQVYFALLDPIDARSGVPGGALKPAEFREAASRCDLALYAAQLPEGLRLLLVYNSDLFGEPRMREMLEQFVNLVEQIVAAPGERIGSYSLLTDASRRLLPNPAITLAEPEIGLTVTEFLSRAAEAPNASAIVDPGTVLSYADLEARSRRIAESLIAGGMARGEVVAVAGARSAGLVAAMLGVLRSGGVLLPLDSALPPQRLSLMMSEAGAQRVVLAGEAAQETFGGLAVTEVRQNGELAGSLPQQEDLPIPSPNDPAYVFFTSGTTGIPKGVLGSQKGLAHFLRWQRETFTIGPGDRCAQLTGLSFDVVLRDVFLPLTSGASLHLPDGDEDTASSGILTWLEHEGITALHTVPSIAQSWLAAVPRDARLDALRWAFFAGEPLTDVLVRRWVEAFPRAGRIVNLYGATETTLAKCFFVVPHDPPAGIQPVGRPLPDTQALVLSEGGRPCGIGEVGEIVLRTPFRTLGYLNAAGEQRSRFVSNPFRQDPRDLLYRTGDRGRHLPDGCLEILGRLDDQVKIRGVRVEPGEVSSVLSRHPAVSTCAVVPRRKESGEIDLVAYVVGRHHPPIEADQLRRDLAQQLSPVMIPSAFVFLGELPLTPNGKLDRAALPPPDPALQKRSPTDSPRTPIEEIVASIWASVLGVEQIAADDNFFELGGHSLNATQVVSRVAQVFGLELPVRVLFEAPTPALLASRVEQSLLDEVENESPGTGRGEASLLDPKAFHD